VKGLHFYLGSVCLFLGLSALLVLVLGRDALLMRFSMPLPEPATEPGSALAATERSPALPEAREPGVEPAPGASTSDPSSSAAE